MSIGDMYSLGKKEIEEIWDESIRRIEASILLEFDSDVHTRTELIALVDEEIIYVHEALKNLVKKGLIRENGDYYALPEDVQHEVDLLKFEAVFNSRLLKEGRPHYKPYKKED